MEHGCGPEQIVWWKYALGIGYMLLEGWMGKTEKTKSGSLLEAIGRTLLGVGTIWKKLVLRNSKNP